MSGPVYVAVCGSGTASGDERRTAERVGELLARAGAVVVCGGLGGVMDAAARGCEAAGGTSIGLLPGPNRSGASSHLTAAVPTGMGEARNALVVRAANAVVAIGGEFGTLSEIGLALKMDVPVIGLGTWSFSREDPGQDPVARAGSPEEAVDIALAAAGRLRS
jgi:uncharacterized protein (TIGR00725 family)